MTCGECAGVFDALDSLADDAVNGIFGAARAATQHEVPEVLRHDLDRLLHPPGAARSPGWRALFLCALTLLGMQVGWEFRAWWSPRFPSLIPVAIAVCAKLGCDWLPAHQVAGIELVARDVREHPHYAHALLVNATFANRNAHARAYPIIQLGMYDHNGTAVGVRRFTPAEYLDISIDISSGIPAGRTVYVTLEIADASDAAESFEFTFL